MEWAQVRSARILEIEGRTVQPSVIGAVIDPGFCLDLISSNGIRVVEQAYADFTSVMAVSGVPMPENLGGHDLLLRNLDCAVINYLHVARKEAGERSFDTVRGVFTEGERVYPNSGFHHKTHTQICVRNPEKIHGVFHVHERYFSQA
ncbi:hypothetical protein [Silvibacterium acidisoli]|uniref:hypothetical protein n=1 Tax=Acidobacteriaceae bacterium ZG23-2 TaxID=2883246 RepID=UPI00406D0013